MKKTIKIVLLLALITLLFTGCSMKENVGITVSKDKKVSVKVISAMDDEMIDYSIGMQSEDSSEEKTYTDEERWAYIESNMSTDEAYQSYTKEKYDQDGYKGYVFTLELGDIDDLSTTDANAPAAFDALNKDSKLFIKDGNKYSLNLKGSSDEEIEQAKSYADYGATFDLKFFVTLPNKAISNNASTVSDDGLTYTWDLLNTNNFELEFNINKGPNMTMILCIVGAVVLVAVVIVVIVIVSKKGKKAPKTNTETSNEDSNKEE